MRKLLLDINLTLHEAGETVEDITKYYKDKFGVQVVLIDASKCNLRSVHKVIEPKFLTC